MKKLILIFIITLTLIHISFESNGQCIADAGNDMSICISMIDSFYLGGSSTVPLGTPPYTYAWSCEYIIGNMVYTASDYLDDTTVANPQLLGTNQDSLTFYLTVSDSLGNICQDTILIKFCWIGYLLFDLIEYIAPGDTISLYSNIWGNCSPLAYTWTPDYNISDLNIGSPLVWPDTSTIYYHIVTDSIGCQSFEMPFRVYVIPTGTSESINEVELQLFPNPASSDVKVEINGIPEVQLEIFNSIGQLIESRKIKNTSSIDVSDYSTGIYYFTFMSKGNWQSSRLMVLH